MWVMSSSWCRCSSFQPMRLLLYSCQHIFQKSSPTARRRTVEHYFFWKKSALCDSWKIAWYFFCLHAWLFKIPLLLKYGHAGDSMEFLRLYGPSSPWDYKYEHRAKKSKDNFSKLGVFASSWMICTKKLVLTILRLQVAWKGGSSWIQQKRRA